jgi:aldehyde:ferredoxin oxidoreductase
MSKGIAVDPQTRPLYGYTGALLRVDLTQKATTVEPLEEAFLRKYVGGATLGIRYVFDEVPPGVEWDDPENRLFIGTGPLGGTRVGGSGSIAVVTKGPQTNGMASTQANGFFGAFLKLSGYNGIILQGASPDWVYLYIHDGVAELRNASHLIGKTTFDVDSIIKEELNKKERQASVLCIGPAGENLVRFACISTDTGHMAAHNGVGAVMGSKRLKAIVVDRGNKAIPIKNKETLSQLAKKILANTLSDKWLDMTYREGTVGGVPGSTKGGFVPTKNYTTSINAMPDDILETYSTESVRKRFNAKSSPCWACSATHCGMMEVPDGEYKGRQFEEPEYEAMAACSSLIGVNDVTTTVVLASEIDRLGMDVNETGYLMAWLIECYEKRILTKEDTDGLEMTWGNGAALMTMLGKIARREGFGNILAEGVMRAARHVGKGSTEMAVHTMKGNSPRGHDHRVQWLELFDTSVSNLGTLETHKGAPYKALGLSPTYDTFDPEVISTVEAKIKGAMLFEDSMVTCRFNTSCAVDLLCEAVNAATGWDMDFQEAMKVGKRAVNLARVFNLRHGIGAELDRPSTRYGSTPLDGVAVGQGIMPHWDKMLQNYYQLMGWDAHGKPLPETLASLELEDIIE